MKISGGGGGEGSGQWESRDRDRDGRAELLTFTVVPGAGFGGTAQLWLEVDLLGDAPLDDGRDRRPR